MKKQNYLILLMAALVLVSGMIGFYIGRQSTSSPIIIEKYPNAVSGDATLTTTTPLLVNINTADLEELQKLPGVGAVIAQNIIDYREANGPFETVTQLTMVKGIGLAKLEALMDYVTVGGTQ